MTILMPCSPNLNVAIAIATSMLKLNDHLDRVEFQAGKNGRYRMVYGRTPLGEGAFQATFYQEDGSIAERRNYDGNGCFIWQAA